MATVINNPSDGDSSAMGVVVGIIVVIILGALFFMYALPAMRNTQAPQDNGGSLNIDVNLPTGTTNTGGTGAGAGTGVDTGTGTGGTGTTGTGSTGY